MGAERTSGRGTILYFSNCNSYHTKKWATYFSTAGYDVHVASLDKPNGDIPGVTTHWLENGGSSSGSEANKLAYLSTVSKARRLIEELDPDIVHAHRAPSNGLVCALACKRPYYLSVWGGDVYEFPRRSPLHRGIVKYSLKRCTWLMSTSRAMADEASKYTDKAMEITPFGVDMELFNSGKRSEHQGLYVGTVKGLEARYGITTLLRACKALHDRRGDLGLRVRIAGRGSQEAELHALALELGMESYVDWLGFIPQEQAACEWASLDVALVPSESESFGVSAVEAQACGVPLIISDIPGLREACGGGRTAIVVPRGDANALADAIEALADDPGRRRAMGMTGREYVLGAYEYNDCFRRIQQIYESHGSVSKRG